MATNTNRVITNIINDMEASGKFDTTSGNQATASFVEFLVTRVFEEIVKNAEVKTNVSGGSSSGSHPGTIL